MKKIVRYFFVLFLLLAFPVHANAQEESLAALTQTGEETSALVSLRLPQEEEKNNITTFQLECVISGNVRDAEFVFAEEILNKQAVSVKDYRYAPDTGKLTIYVSGREAVLTGQPLTLGTIHVTQDTESEEATLISVVNDSFVIVDAANNDPRTVYVSGEDGEAPRLEIGGSSEPTEKVFQVTFESNGGSAVPSQGVKQGENIIVPADPEREGYLFAGWYADKELTILWDFKELVKKDMTLYAKWEVKSEEESNPPSEEGGTGDGNTGGDAGNSGGGNTNGDAGNSDGGNTNGDAGNSGSGNTGNESSEEGHEDTGVNMSGNKPGHGNGASAESGEQKEQSSQTEEKEEEEAIPESSEVQESSEAQESEEMKEQVFAPEEDEAQPDTAKKSGNTLVFVVIAVCILIVVIVITALFYFKQQKGKNHQ